MMPSTTNRVPVQRWVPAVLLAGSLLVNHGAKAQWASPPLGGTIPGGTGAGTGYGLPGSSNSRGTLYISLNRSLQTTSLRSASV